jgi:drug/metabolite transporter (DMT)-like permease
MPDPAARLRGIGLYCLAVIFFTGIDTCAKYASRSLPSIEVAWLRFVFHALFALIVLRPWRNWAVYRTRRPLAQGLRAVFLFLSTVLNFAALRTMQLDQTTTINFSAAFCVAALAGPLLGEWVGPRRWAAIMVGFVGVLIVTRPGTDHFQPAMILSVGGMLASALYSLMTRLLTATETNVSLLFYSALVPSLLLAPFALPVAEFPPTLLVGLALVGTGVFGAAGHYLLILAHRIMPASGLAPFYYSQLAWTITAGYLVFGDLPDAATLAGAAVIVASGLYILYRERVYGER